MNFSVKIRKNRHIESSSFVRVMDQYASILSKNPLIGMFEVFGNDVDRNHMIETAEVVRYCTVSLMDIYPGASIIKIWKVSEENGVYSAEVRVDDDDMGILYAATDAVFVPRLLVTKGHIVVRDADEPYMIAERVIALDYVVNNSELFARFKGLYKPKEEKHEGFVHTDALRSDIRLEEVGGIV